MPSSEMTPEALARQMRWLRSRMQSGALDAPPGAGRTLGIEVEVAICVPEIVTDAQGNELVLGIRPLRDGAAMARVFEALKDDATYTEELLVYNVELHNFVGGVAGEGFAQLQAWLQDKIATLQRTVDAEVPGAVVMMAGIAPYTDRGDVHPSLITPKQRYLDLKDEFGHFPYDVTAADGTVRRYLETLGIEGSLLGVHTHLSAEDAQGLTDQLNSERSLLGPKIALYENSPWTPLSEAQDAPGHEERLRVLETVLGPRADFGKGWLRHPMEFFELAAQFSSLMKEPVTTEDKNPLNVLVTHLGTYYTMWRPQFWPLRSEDRMTSTAPLADILARTVFNIGTELYNTKELRLWERMPSHMALANKRLAQAHGIDAHLWWPGKDGTFRQTPMPVITRQLVAGAREHLAKAGADPDFVKNQLAVMQQTADAARTGAVVQREIVGALVQAGMPFALARGAMSLEYHALQESGRPLCQAETFTAKRAEQLTSEWQQRLEGTPRAFEIPRQRGSLPSVAGAEGVLGVPGKPLPGTTRSGAATTADREVAARRC